MKKLKIEKKTIVIVGLGYVGMPIAVPTPVIADRTPDFKPLEWATSKVERNLTKGSIFVFESTLYPGVTEEIYIPILEKESGMNVVKISK